MKIKKIIFSLLTVMLCIAMTLSSAVFAQDDLSSLKDKGNKLTSNQIAIDKALEQAKKNTAEQQKLKLAYDNKIKSVEEKIDNLNATILIYDKQIESCTVEINILEKEIESGYEQLRARLKSIYMAGDTSTLEILMGVKDFNEFIDTANLIKTLSRQDQQLIDNLQNSISVVKQKQDKVNSDKTEVLKSRTQLETQRKDLNILQKECDKALKNLKISTQELTKQKEESEKQQLALSNEIAKWHIQYIKEHGTALSDISEDSTKYVWPATECHLVTAYWGDSRNHKGVDITCNGSSYGSPIVAAASGKVIKANKTDSWGSGWGYYTMIDHGSGFATQYAHCSYVAVNVGDTVKAGQIIGYIGNSGNSQGAHLHFECWFNGERYNPAIRLGL